MKKRFKKSYRKSGGKRRKNRTYRKRKSVQMQEPQPPQQPPLTQMKGNNLVDNAKAGLGLGFGATFGNAAANAILDNF